MKQVQKLLMKQVQKLLMASSETKSNVTHSLENGTLTIYSDKFFDLGYRSTIEISSVEKLVIDGATKIPSMEFMGYENLESVSLSNTVTTIGEQAFYGCSSLTGVRIPESVSSIGDGTFFECTSLKEITVNENNKNYSSSSGILFNKNKTELICFPSSNSSTHYSIPSTVTSLRTGAFFSCENLDTITLSARLQTIGEGTFFGCSSLEIMYIPESVTSIGAYAFGECTEISIINIPKSVVKMGEGVFYAWTEEQTINISSVGQQPATWSDKWNLGCKAKIKNKE